MGHHPRIECRKIASFQTTRTRNSRLWFVNNARLEHYILGYAARYSARYDVKLYALAIEGNHIQMPAHFSEGNRAFFMRDFNSAVARAVARHQPRFPGGPVWHRRYSAEFLPGAVDIEDRFFYTVLQPVNDGLVDDIKHYPGYNCFEDAITGTVRHYRVVHWKEFNDARRWNPSVSIEQFTEWCPLKFERLPGYESLSQGEYAALMRKKLSERTAEVLKTRRVKRPLGASRLRRIIPGAIPKNTKVSGRYDHRPRVLSKCPVRRSVAEAWYFDIYFRFKESSKRYRAGETDVVFPEGTYKPPLFTVFYFGSVRHDSLGRLDVSAA
jgi:hypothetical protein